AKRRVIATRKREIEARWSIVMVSRETEVREARSRLRALAPRIIAHPRRDRDTVAAHHLAHAPQMIACVEVVRRPLLGTLLEVVPHYRRPASLLAGPGPAPHEGLVLRLRAALELLDAHAVRLPVVFVHALVRPMQLTHQPVLLIPPELPHHAVVR